MTRSTRNGRATIRSGRVAPSVRAALPRAEAETLLVEYAQMMHGRVTGAGGPDFDWRPHVAAFFAGLDRVLPPKAAIFWRAMPPGGRLAPGRCGGCRTIPAR